MFEQQLENDMAALLSACGVKVYTRGTVPEEPEYPHILVMCDRESDCGFGESVIVRSADLLVLASTYRSDDPDGARLREIVEKISGTLLAPGLRTRLPDAAIVYHGTHVLDSYPSSDLRTHGETAQVTLKFSPKEKEEANS